MLSYITRATLVSVDMASPAPLRPSVTDRGRREGPGSLGNTPTWRVPDTDRPSRGAPPTPAVLDAGMPCLIRGLPNGHDVPGLRIGGSRPAPENARLTCLAPGPTEAAGMRHKSGPGERHARRKDCGREDARAASRRLPALEHASSYLKGAGRMDNGSKGKGPGGKWRGTRSRLPRSRIGIGRPARPSSPAWMAL